MIIENSVNSGIVNVRVLILKPWFGSSTDATKSSSKELLHIPSLPNSLCVRQEVVESLTVSKT
jgi:hypothetical protein